MSKRCMVSIACKNEAVYIDMNQERCFCDECYELMKADYPEILEKMKFIFVPFPLKLVSMKKKNG